MRCANSGRKFTYFSSSSCIPELVEVFSKARIQFRGVNLFTIQRGSSSLFTTSLTAAFKHYPQRSIADKLIVGSTHKLAYREKRTRTTKVKVPLVNAQWETLPCGIRCKAVRVRGCGLRSCHVSAGIDEAPGRPVMPKRTTKRAGKVR